jgi:hypothetical protein
VSEGHCLRLRSHFHVLSFSSLMKGTATPA